MGLLVRRLVLEDGGQDLVEYALLIGLVAVASVVAINSLRTAMHDAYATWDTRNQDLWEMPAPGGP